MISETRADEEHISNGHYPISTVSKLTGVNAITLRAWERRYGLIEPIRRKSGHRLYTREHIDLINRVVGLLDRGMRIGQVKAYLDVQQPVGATVEDQGPADTWRSFIEGMLGGVIRFDETALEEIYNEALSGHNIRTVMSSLVMPLLVELGDRWESGFGSVAEEHFFGFYLRNKLGAQYHHRSMRVSGPRILMACIPGERHENGLLFFGLALNDAGFFPVMLGADMPMEEIPAAVVKTDSEAIVLSSAIGPSSEIINKQLPQLVSSVDVPVCLGGRASIDLMSKLDRIGVYPLGVDIEVGIKRLEQMLSA
jgi:DNA-binding transcriptional MerR regulator/methylmalonyl-CoA mutase cobalamin-binding subunit